VIRASRIPGRIQSRERICNPTDCDRRRIVTTQNSHYCSELWRVAGIVGVHLDAVLAHRRRCCGFVRLCQETLILWRGRRGASGASTVCEEDERRFDK
jgi:hypothetical protein